MCFVRINMRMYIDHFFMCMYACTYAHTSDSMFYMSVCIHMYVFCMYICI
jgi:hypothetical protein